MKLKPGVKLKGLTAQMLMGVIVIGDTYAGFGAECTMTSCNDGKHSEASLHYSGNAVDTRTKDFAGDKHLLLAKLKENLGSDFDVVLEAEGEENEHIHTEYDPKGG